MSINHTNVNIAAAATIVVSAAVTIGCSLMILNPAISTVAFVVFAVLAGLGCASGWAGIAAWISTDSGRVSDYANNYKTCLGYATIGLIQIVAHTLFQAIIQALAQAVYNAVLGRFSNNKSH